MRGGNGEERLSMLIIENCLNGVYNYMEYMRGVNIYGKI